MTDVDPLLGGGDQGKAAASAVKLPAIILIALGGAGVLLSLASMLMPQMQDFSQMPAEQREIMELLAGPIKYLLYGGLLVLNGLIVLGAVKMLNLASRGMAIFACILALLNVQCCCLTLPFGIWGLMVLNDEKVKAGFERNATPDF